MVNELVSTGARPKLPHDCPGELKALLEECWAICPNDTPRFANICARIEKYKPALVKGPIIVREGMPQEEQFDLSTSYSYIDEMLAKHSQLRTLEHNATN